MTSEHSKERISLPPAQGVMSVFLDEVHMLTTRAFNALLKVLEEPPAHVIFILATTELHKLSQRWSPGAKLSSFGASAAELFDALQNIVKKEKLTAEPAVLEAVCQKADGSFRDAVKLLELIHQQGELDPSYNRKSTPLFSYRNQKLSLSYWQKIPKL
jgi:DNA polymerase-3 subunit gamma/tau